MHTTLNLGILAHVDAGKTSLTERLLYTTGVIDHLGRVDAGTTQTDTLALERRRGITIRSAVACFAVGDLTVNLLDTPGHPDFIAEVERVLGVLDGAILVISAVEGVQAQTRLLIRALQRLAIPTLLFVNKIDRRGADPDRVLDAIAAKLTPHALALGTVKAPGEPAVRFLPYGRGVTPPGLVDLLADLDLDFVGRYVDADGAVSVAELRGRLAEQSRSARLYPVLFGSAVTGAGIGDLLRSLTELLPPASGDPGGPVSATAFTVQRGPAGEKVALLRMFSGTLAPRDRVVTPGGREATVTGTALIGPGPATPGAPLTAGRIGRVWGLDLRVGDTLGGPGPTERPQFAPPTLATVVIPRRAADRGALQTALTQLAEQDPLIAVRTDDGEHELAISLYGEVQKEVLEATLAEEFGLEVSFTPTTPICIERVVGSGAAVEHIDTGENPFLATVGLRVDLAPTGSGVSFDLEVERGAMPTAFFAAVEEALRASLGRGLHGWPVPDAAVTMTHSGYWARQSSAHGTFDKSMSSTAGDFRLLTPLVLMDALRRAGTEVLEPMHRLRLELPADTLPMVISALARRDGVPGVPVIRGPTVELTGGLAAGQVHAFTAELPGLTHGEGLLTAEFAGHRPVRGQVPSRRRTDAEPRDRRAYLLRVTRETPGRSV